MTAWLERSVLGGGLIDLIIGISLLEVIGLLVYHYRTKRGLMPREYLLNIGSGLCLMLALRCALTGSAWYIISAFLLVAGLAHAVDIALRLLWQAAIR